MSEDTGKVTLFESAGNELKKRMVSPIFGTFAIYWAVFHWQFLVTMFLVSSEQIWIAKGMLKAEYLKIAYANPHDWYFYVSWILPALLTFSTIWYFPRWFILRADQKDTDYRVDRENIRLLGEQKLIKAETEVEKTQTKLAVEKNERAKKEKLLSVTDPTSAWRNDYTDFKLSLYFEEFEKVIQSIYQKSGSVQDISLELLSYIHSNQLVEIAQKNDPSGFDVIDVISLTEKGRFFVKLYSQERGNI